MSVQPKAVLLGIVVLVLAGAVLFAVDRDRLWLMEAVCDACERADGRDYDAVRASGLQRAIGSLALRTRVATPIAWLYFITLANHEVHAWIPEPVPDSSACRIACYEIHWFAPR